MTLARTLFTAILLAASFSPLQAVAEASANLEASFLNPPNQARPKIWWFWGESVTTDHGITRDLEAMKRVGFGGVVLYEQVFSDPADALKSLSPEWLARFRFAVAECARLGLSLDVNVSGGFVAGGPWITPELAMQRLVGTETTVQGGQLWEITLPQPAAKLGFYRDVAVLAYPTPAGASPAQARLPKLSSSTPIAALDSLLDPTPGKRVRMTPVSKSAPVLVDLDYGTPFTARSITYTQRTNAKALVIATQVPSSWADDFYGENMRLNPPLGHLEASSDGQTWTRVCELPALGYQHDTWTQQTVAFPAVTARFFRLNFHDWGRNSRANDDDLVVGNLALSAQARLDHWESKSGNVVAFSDPDRSPEYTQEEALDPSRVIDLSSKLGADGRLSWDAPPGSWTILRLGYTPTGVQTKHARPEMTGLECDKLSAQAVRVQFENYVGVLLREASRVPGGKIAGVGIDSNEHGAQNWTPDFPAQFKRRRGYDLQAFLPAMLGRVVGDRERSDKFLFDVRRTIADLMSDAYFGTFQQLCRERGLTLTAQAPGIATCLPSDNIQAKGRTDIPMGEFWMSQKDGTIDCREAASAAHVYGLPIAAAEAFTGSRADVHPGMMKPFADAALAQGINQFVVLAYVHQPWDDRKPGVTEPRFYLPYQRNNTWWESSRGFWTGLARSSQLLQQGLPASELLYHLGSDTPLKIATWRMRPVPPEGYDFDVCNDEILLTRLAVRNGLLETPEHKSYRLLVLAGGESMTLSAARRLRDLVHAGACVLGPQKPKRTPSLSDGPQGDAELRAIVEELWGPGELSPRGTRQTGAGKMFWGQSPGELLQSLGLAPDFETSPRGNRLDVLFAHRKSGDLDLYFVANHRSTALRTKALFRVTGKKPSLWNPVTGTLSAPLHWRQTEDGRTEIEVLLEAHDSVFVVFGPEGKLPAGDPSPAKLVEECPVLQTLHGVWQVFFEPKLGGPGPVAWHKLSPWNEALDLGIRHYSGEATYRLSFNFSAGVEPGQVILDLGEVGILCSVTLNGRELGLRWKAPFAFDLGEALKVGKNDLEVRVMNTWMNRLIADTALPPDKRITWTTDNPYRSSDPLQKSGLLGPVQLRNKAPQTSAATEASSEKL